MFDYPNRLWSSVTWICVSRNFWWLRTNQREWWDNFNERNTELIDVLAKNAKKEDDWWSFILEELHFASWCLGYFLWFCCFASYGIWSVVLHGMSAPRSDVGGGALLLEYLLFGDAWFANGKKEGTWWGEEINT